MAAKTTSLTGRARSDPAGGGRRPATGGFTLIELILVMTLICAMLGMAAPSLRGFFASHQTSDAAGQIVSLMQYARNQAVSEGRPYRLNFDTAAGTYWLTVQDGASFAPLQSDFGQVFSLPEATTFDLQSSNSAPSNYIDFLPSELASGPTIRLAGRNGVVMEISSPSLTEPYQVAPVLEGTTS